MPSARPPASNTESVPPEDGADGEGDADDRTYCFCNGVSYGQMIACDDEQCEREWVRFRSLTLLIISTEW